MPGIYVIMELRLFRLLIVNIDNFDLPNAVGKIKCLRNVTKILMGVHLVIIVHNLAASRTFA